MASDAVKELVRLLDAAGVTVTFDPLRDPAWHPTREDYGAFASGAKEIVDGLRAEVASLRAERDAAREERDRLRAWQENAITLLHSREDEAARERRAGDEAREALRRCAAVLSGESMSKGELISALESARAVLSRGARSGGGVSREGSTVEGPANSPRNSGGEG